MRSSRLALTLLLLALASCDGDSPTSVSASFEVMPASASLSEGASLQLQAVGPDGPVTAPVSWSSSRPEVAAVDSGGLVTTRNGLGVARITATVADASAVAAIEVSSDCAAPLAIDGAPSGDREVQTMEVTLAPGVDVQRAAQAMADFYGFAIEAMLPDGFRAALDVATVASIRCRDDVAALRYAG